MSEPAGLMIQCTISTKELSACFRKQVDFDGGKAKVGHALCALLDWGDPGDVLIVHHDPEAETLFLAWVLNHYSDEALQPIWPILDALAATIEAGAATGGTGVVATTLPDLLEVVALNDGGVTRRKARNADASLAPPFLDRLWNFARNDQFPDAEGSMARRELQCKPFRTSWKTYQAWKAEQEKPARIAAATAEDPFELLPDVFTTDGLVFRRDRFTGRDIPFPGADPLSFRQVNDFYADHAHVWQRQLAAGSPVAMIVRDGRRTNNREAIWEYVPVDGASGASFRWLFDRWDTVFWCDAARVYACDNSRKLVTLPGVDPQHFRDLGAAFGSDGSSVWRGDQQLPIDPQQVQTRDSFIWDNHKVFHRSTELPLKGRGFRVLGAKFIRPAIHKAWRLTDGETTIILMPDGAIAPDEAGF